MSKNKLEDVSRFLSYVLRHKPESIGLNLDTEGWAAIDKLLSCANQSGQALDTNTIRAVVEISDKKRFAISEDGLRIRAVQGHSTDSVSISYVEKVPPEILYHGTAERFLESILKEGLKSGSRQYVHLSDNIKTAHSVGQRHGKPIILKIKALQMHQQGFKFFQADNGVWLIEQVPAIFLQD